MLKIDKKTRSGVILARLLLTAFVAVAIGFLSATPAKAFDWARFTFIWERPDGVDQVIYKVDYVEINGDVGSYERVLTDRDQITDDLAFDTIYTINLIPVVGGLRGASWVEYIVKPKRRSDDDRTLSF